MVNPSFGNAGGLRTAKMEKNCTDYSGFRPNIRRLKEQGRLKIRNQIFRRRPLQKSLSPNSQNPNTGFRLFPPLIAPDFTQIPP